ncbi:MAG: hypothetical protein WCO71_07955 [Pseudomonadota bacterium]
MKLLGMILLAALSITATLARGEVVSGKIENWCESGAVFDFDAATSRAGLTEMKAFWSSADESSGTGYFYGGTLSGSQNIEVAVASNISDITQITDASTYTFTQYSVGPLGVGTIVVYHNSVTGYYGAIKVDAIQSTTSTCPYHQDVLNGTWFIQNDGTANFSR